MSERPTWRSPAGKQVLVVEDDTAIAEMLIMLLEGEGYQVTWVDTAPAAMKVLGSPAAVADLAGAPTPSGPTAWKPRPDVVLLDLRLPGMDGAEMVRRLSQTGQVVPPIIVISAKPRAAVEVEADSIGAANVIHKPFHIEALLESLDLVFAQSA